MSRPRFTLRAILGCTAVLCVTLALIAAVGEPVALFCLPMVVGGCVGYLMKDWDGVPSGVLFGFYLGILLAIPILAIYAWLAR